MRSRSLFFTAILAAGSASALAADPTPEQVQFFESKVRPVLSAKCYKCHSLEEGKAKGGLTLDSKAGVLKGGDTGEALKPGDPDASLLIQAITYKDKDLQMPPKGEKLSDQEIAVLTAWVKMGAPDPRSETAATKLTGLTEKARDHWAFQPVKKPAIPVVKNRAWCVTPVDAFILEKLEAKGMVPSPPAQKETLLRRATYDLIGLPPTPQEIYAFLADESPQAFVKVVDRLLASPHYGERWGRFWLDSARYSDTTGGERDARRADYRFPYAWTYRDWVIKAFNDDMPYDQFVLQQLAADKLPRNTAANSAALGFLTVGERFNNANDIINDRIDVVTKGFLGLTVSCARCHDHMFDPIPTEDYYALHGIFASTVEASEQPLLGVTEDPKLATDFKQKLEALEQENRTKYFNTLTAQTEKFREKPSAYLIAGHKRAQTSSEKDQQEADAMIRSEELDVEIMREARRELRRDDPILGPLARMQNGDESFAAVMADAAKPGSKTNPLVVAALKDLKATTFEDVAKGYDKVFASVGAKAKDIFQAYSSAQTSTVTVDMPLKQLVIFPFEIKPAPELTTESLRQISGGWPQQMQNRANFAFAKINELILTHEGAPAKAMAVADVMRPRDSQVFIRGQADVRGDTVPRRFLEVLSDGRPRAFKQGSGRLELAQAIASKKNPLTARVMVNRVWMHHFGQGFVRTPDDIGTQSEAPSHPELIDYLSHYFMEQGWSLKKLHKLIMLSKVYQNSSYKNAPYEVADPENRLLWRANIRRLDFEALRDSLLVFSGQLDRALVRNRDGSVSPAGGQPVNLTDEPYSYRRSVYGYIDRGNLPELMSAFDFSNPEMTNSARTTTIVPQQALFLMNSPMAVDVARRIIARPEVASERKDHTRILRIYEIIFQRQPKPEEIQMGVAFLTAENKAQTTVAAEMKENVEKAQKAVEKKYQDMMGRNDGAKAIQNKGKLVERRPLTPYETYAHALLLSNEASYIN
ncbi:MAG: PSD1 and planctomycete cytochrome C domain-containing protein [Chthoniobacteraceae bacterium]